MPGIILTHSGLPDPAQADALAAELAELTCRYLKKERGRTMVMLRHQPKDQWYIAGTSLEKDGRNSFRLEVSITEETNTKDEKAAFHKAAFALLSERLGNLHPHSNVHVIDCRATSYGYGGVTQEWRYQQGSEGLVAQAGE
ncbi:tautomerase family protein [Celeribacter neptunius]|uniref:4-oxalocrotonate tautomerase n=1 Tax=Celeribacter neptunius TaxID=588602 RepID=A0A1I3K9Z1_9RHOB|nr:tautomerase family protein [Celeribacter neptunius]SFI69204.1 4-oxalocrotonate tautomerase [Celeribacter neptunius]